MPIKIYRNKFEHVHENIFFRELALELTKLYENRKEHAVLIGNPVILDEDGNKIAPDALFLSKSSFDIIDFKNFEGEITIPTTHNFEIESWKRGNIVVKGGSQINPYIQLKNHKQKLGDYLNFHKSKFLSKSSKFHPKYIDCIVCFINPVKLCGDIPELERNWFFIKDKKSIISALDDITTTRINLSDGDLERLAHLFSTTSWNPEETVLTSSDFEEQTIERQYDLTEEQSRVFSEIQDFIRSEEENALIISGSYSCGKTFLINHLIRNIPKNTASGWQVLAPNNRIARNVRKQIESVSSLYSYIFKFSEQIEIPIEKEKKTDIIVIPAQNDNDANTEIFYQEDEEHPELVDTKLIFNIRENNDSENFLYIIDEAHHISDASFISPTIQFGTGQLLADLITYINTEKSKRKILFIGDKYRLGVGNYEESALCKDYLQSEYSLKCKEIEIQPYPPTNTNILKQAFSIRNQIIKNQYNQLNLVDSDVVKIAKSDSNLDQAMRKHFSEELYNTKILAFSNENILESNNWVRSKVLNKNSELEKGDLVVINNNVIVAPDNPFAVPQKIFKGEFAEVLIVSNDTISISQPFKGEKTVQLFYRELKLKLVERNLEVNVMSFENYWNSTANEINREEYIAIQAYINQKISVQIKEEKVSSDEWRDFITSEQYKTLKSEIYKFQKELDNGKQVKTKLETSKKNLRKVENNFWRNRRIEIHKDIVYHDKYVNAVNLQYGYALTVHRAQSYKWNHIFFNLNQGDDRGTDNKGYFKWVYSGIGCAKSRLYLINTPQITPYIKMVWKDNHGCITNTDDNKDFFPFTNDTPIKLREKPTYFESVSDFLFNFYCWLSSELDIENISVKKVEHKDYAEHYQFIRNNNEEAKVIIWYDGQNRFKKHNVVTSSSDEFRTLIDEFLTSLKSSEIIVTKSGNSEFSDLVVTELFNKLNNTFEKNGISIISVTQKNYSDRIILKKEDDIFIFDIFLNSEGFITTVYPIKCNSPEIYDIVKIIFNEFIEKHGKPLTIS